MIIKDKKFCETMTNEIEPFLEKIRNDAFFRSFDGNEIHYEAYINENAKASVLVLHGFCESAEKFREAVYYFYNESFNVFAPDLRGHGRSFRTSLKEGTVNIDSFDEYKKDLEVFIKAVVKKDADNLPLLAYTHSLGSTVVLLYMAENENVIDKCVLSSPMICGNMGMPVAVAGSVAKLVCSVGGKNISAPGRCVFDENQSFENSDSVSEERFYYYHNKRKENPLYRTNGPAFCWVKASLEARDKILETAEKLKGDFLVIRPAEDKQLLSSYQDKFISLAKNVKVLQTENTKHEIFSSESETLEKYYKDIFDFFGV